MCLMYILAIAKYNSANELAIETFFKCGDQTEMFEDIYSSKYYVRALKILLPFFKSRGLLDKLKAE